jgi:hypothetical protein
MKRFIGGGYRGQTTLMPGCLDDNVTDTNPVRVVDVFVDELDLFKPGFVRIEPAAAGRPPDPPGPLGALHLRLPEPHPIQPPFGERSATQHGAHVAHWRSGTGFQDHRQLPQGQRQSNSWGLPTVCGPVPATRLVFRGYGGHRRQQVQGGQQP